MEKKPEFCAVVKIELVHHETVFLRRIERNET
jgi:hypothetical protein